MILNEPVPLIRDRSSSGFSPEQPGVGDSIANNDNHPLAGLSPQRRSQERIDAIALILARLALKSISKDKEASK